jgi:Cation transporter/ATPase, N-terminus
MTATADKTEPSRTAPTTSWYEMPAVAVCREFGVDPDAGLNPAEVERRRAPQRIFETGHRREPRSVSAIHA